MTKKKYATSTHLDKRTRLTHPATEHHFDKDDKTDHLIKRHVKILVPTTNRHAKSGGKVGKPVVKDWVAGNAGRTPRPERHLMNFAFEDPTDHGKHINDFDPPLEIRVPLSADELGKNTELVYWDGSQWTDVPDSWLVMEAGKKYLEENNEFVAQLKHWPDDPPSGMAP
jgi:hypothetical protein